MKRFLAIVLFVAYSSATMGMSLNLDYCCGELSGLSVALEYVPGYDCAAKSSKDGCCASTHLDLKKIEDNQLASEQIKLPAAPIAELVLLPTFPFVKYLQQPAATLRVAQVWRIVSPPPKLRVSCQVLFCTFRV